MDTDVQEIHIIFPCSKFGLLKYLFTGTRDVSILYEILKKMYRNQKNCVSLDDMTIHFPGKLDFTWSLTIKRERKLCNRE